MPNRLCLLEFDERFGEECKEGEFYYYNCEEPTAIPESICHQFDFVLGDPPRLFDLLIILCCIYLLSFI